MKTRLEQLIDIIKDPDALDHEKDDAALDLAEFDDSHALEVLIEVSKTPQKSDEFALENYGETIGKMWLKRNYFSLDIYNSLHPLAKNGIYSVINYYKPEWVNKFIIRK